MLTRFVHIHNTHTHRIFGNQIVAQRYKGLRNICREPVTKLEVLYCRNVKCLVFHGWLARVSSNDFMR